MKIVVGGVAGGTGATTVAAALAHALGAGASDGVVLVDHDGGSLAARAGDIGAAAPADHDVVDLGALTTSQRWEALVSASSVPVLTAPMTPSGMAQLRTALATVRAHAPEALARLVLVATGAGVGDADWLSLAADAPQAARCVVPRDRTLAQGGTIVWNRVGGGARRGIQTIVAAVTDRSR